ncbi:MAG: TrkH family potassium uptake protein [Bacillota bacterium]
MSLNIYRRKLYTIIIINSYLLIVLAGILIIPLIVSILLKENGAILAAYIIAILSALIPGILMNIHNKLFFGKKNINLNISTSMMAVSAGWLLSSLIGSIPLYFALELSFIDALFESVSGFTTTGITVLQGLEDLPKSIILWRSIMQWLGGLGILTFFLLISTRFPGNIWQLYSAESHKINSSRPVPNVFKTIRILWTIYALFTISQTILLIIFQVPIFDAISHSLTTISTGGFSSYDSSIGYYARTGHPFYRQIEYIIVFFMFLGGINFFLHYKFLTGDLKAPFKNAEFKSYIKIIITVLVIILLAIFFINKEEIQSIEEVFRKVLFQVISILTTTGYETQNIASSFFPVFTRQIFLLLMLIGGSVGSTSGGLKILRIIILKRLFGREIKKIYYSSHSVLPVTLDKNIIDKEEIYRIAAMLFAWLLLIISGVMLTALFSDLDALQSFSGMFSAVGNIGPFYFSVSKMAELSPVIKITYMIGMLAGRLEIFPLFLLFTRGAWKSQFN